MNEQLRVLLESILLTAKTADGWKDGETFYKSAIESIRETTAEAIALLPQPPAQGKRTQSAGNR